MARSLDRLDPPARQDPQASDKPAQPVIPAPPVLRVLHQTLLDRQDHPEDPQVQPVPQETPDQPDH